MVPWMNQDLREFMEEVVRIIDVLFVKEFTRLGMDQWLFKRLPANSGDAQGVDADRALRDVLEKSPREKRINIVGQYPSVYCNTHAEVKGQESDDATDCQGIRHGKKYIIMRASML